MRVRGLLRRLSLACLALVAAAPLSAAVAKPLEPELAFTLGDALPNPTDDRPPTVPMRLAVSKDGDVLYVLRAGGSLETWDVSARTRTATQEAGGLFAAAPDAGSFLTRSATGDATITSRDGNPNALFPTSSALGALSGVGDTLALVGEFGRVDVWSLAGEPAPKTFQTALPARNGLAVSRDGSLIAAAEGTHGADEGHRTVIEVWRRGEDEAFLTLDGRATGLVLGVWNVLFSPDGSLLAADTQKDGKSGIRVWELPGGEVRVGADGFNAYWARALAFSDDSRYAASGDETGNVWIRDLDGGRTRHFSRAGVVQSLAFSADGRHLAVGRWDSTVEFWRVGTSE
ncbi:WD40 repeat domain-containing protein [Candidatus Poribacteria bacterium]|jgi:WD40 repeat protein|nr:WD40 repeat domain-containing protein [Candidatus Poribacteria bacterium]